MEAACDKHGSIPGLKGCEASPARMNEGDEVALLVILIGLFDQIPEKIDVDEFGLDGGGHKYPDLMMMGWKEDALRAGDHPASPFGLWRRALYFLKDGREG